MNKIFTILVMSMISLVFHSNLNAQAAPTFTFSPSAITAGVGQSFTVDFEVESGFTDLVGLQFAVTWDAANLQFDGVTNVIGTPSNPNAQIFGYNTNNPLGTNRLLNSWSDPLIICLLYTSPSPRDATLSRMPSSA